jgi:hypothetical protein
MSGAKKLKSLTVIVGGEEFRHAGYFTSKTETESTGTTTSAFPLAFIFNSKTIG